MADQWMRRFLSRRKLESPDGRVLYAYRATEDEFVSLGDMLREEAAKDTLGDGAVRAFVLYAAEWWQRKYDGGRWAWEPLLQSIEWHRHYPDLYEPVKRAWRWWRIKPVRLPSSVRYLGTFACHGGLPLALVGSPDSDVARYLRSVLKHTAAYRKFVVDPVELAQEKQHLLRPPTLRRDYVFRLAAGLITAVLDIQANAQSEDPIAELDRVRPTWRDTMPLDLADGRAEALLKGLLQDAKRETTSQVGDFRVDRFLLHTAAGWRLGARVRLPGSMPSDQLARQIGVPEPDLPARLEVRVQGERYRVAGLYAAREYDHVLIQRQMSGSDSDLWDEEASGDIVLQFVCGRTIGEAVIPYRGRALGVLPWIFRVDDECPFVGEGTVRNRSPELIVLAPSDSRVTSATASAAEDASVLGRSIWRLSESAQFDTGNGICRVTPGADRVSDEDYRLAGPRHHDLDCRYRLFLGVPKLYIDRPDQPPRAVPATEISWKGPEGEWSSAPDSETCGIWQVRHQRDGELRFLERVGILPREFTVSLEPGGDISEGTVVLDGAQGVRAVLDGDDVHGSHDVDGATTRIHVKARDAGLPPSRFSIHLDWRGSRPLIVHIPFPGSGGRFSRDGEPLQGPLAVNNLHGVRATALSPNASDRFFIDGELRAMDLGDLVRVAYLRRELPKSALAHELPLIEIRSRVESLLASSSSDDAHVVLRITNRWGVEQATTQVWQYAFDMEYEEDDGILSIPSPSIVYEALPVARPGDTSVLLEPMGFDADSSPAVLPQDLNLDEPWLVLARRDTVIVAHPLLIQARWSAPIDEDESSLERAVMAPHSTQPQLIQKALDAMVKNDDTETTDRNWQFLTETLLCADDLPASSLDVLKHLVSTPRLLVRSAFRLEQAPRKILWQLEEVLPFSWLLIKRTEWWDEARRAVDRLAAELADIEDGETLAREHIVSILEEGAAYISALDTIETDIAIRLEGGRLSKDLVDAVTGERDRKTVEQIQWRSTRDDWPRGDGRQEWIEELEGGKLLNKLWQNTNELRVRTPLFDTPVAAAWCCFLSPPTPRTVFLVKRIREQDPEWFDIAYSAIWYKLARIQDNGQGR